MIEEIEKEEKELKSVKCPVCEVEFRDLRGLTSHSRNTHGMSKNEIYSLLDEERTEEESNGWGFLVGAGVFLISIFGLGRFR